MPAEFVHLHVHTEYSLLDGACRLDRLFKRAAELRFPALALTDHGTLHGAIEFYKQGRSSGIKPIIGCEVYVAPGSRFDKTAQGTGRDVYHHLVLLAKNVQGYHNLVRLVTAAQFEGFYYKPRIDKELLAQHHEGLIALSGCLASEIPEGIIRGDLGRARDAVDWYKQTFGADDFYLEMQNHRLPEQGKVNRQLIAWAKDAGLKLVATNDVHYIERQHSRAHDTLICIGTQALVSDPKRLRYAPEQFYLRSADEMMALFAETPDAVSNTLEIAEKCDLQIEFGKLHYPVFHPPESFTREGYLRKLVAEGMVKRYGLHLRVAGDEFIFEGLDDAARLPSLAPTPEATIQAILERLRYELRIIEQTGFVSYFLIVADFVQHGRSMGVSCVARGSAAGSLVTYLLEIANVDPLRYGLIFERFLNPERVNPPDIDIDFADDRRGEVIEYVRNKYGRDAVAQIITFGTLGAKSVLRDVGRAKGLNPGDCDRFSRLLLDLPDLETALAMAPDFRQAYETEPRTRDVVDTALVLENLVRNTGIHAAGIVIGDQPLVNLLPLKRDEKGTVTQYAMEAVGELGLLKMDFLGLKTLSVIRNTCELVKLTQGIDVPMDHLPLDDAKTYAMLNRAETLGVFQLESGGMRDLCAKFQLASLEHITALVALFRPGPMELIPEFINRRHNRVKVEYEHPLLESISRETYGILIYQEQVMQAAQVLAGYSLGEADLLRRAMGKKKPEEMAKHRTKFVRGAKERNNIPEDKAHQIFDLLEKFAGYGFNKSHAAAYAMVAYQTAYLKAHYPVEFFSAMMTNDIADSEKLAEYIAEAKMQDIRVLPPDINQSLAGFAPTRDGRAIRFGLGAIQGVGDVALHSILKARQEGPFKSLSDLCERIDGRALNRKILEALVKAGACDCFQVNRATLFSRIERTLEESASVIADRQVGQGSLFGDFEAALAPRAKEGAGLPEWPQKVLLRYEKEMLGCYVSGHPLDPFADVLGRYARATTRQLKDLPNRARTRIGGMVTALQTGVAKKSGKPYALVTLEDTRGTVQLISVGESYERTKEALILNSVVIVLGEVSNAEGELKLFVKEALPIEEAAERLTEQIRILLPADESGSALLERVQQLAGAHQGRCPLLLDIKDPDGNTVTIKSKHAVRPSPEFRAAVEELLGVGAYQEFLRR